MQDTGQPTRPIVLPPSGTDEQDRRISRKSRILELQRKRRRTRRRIDYYVSEDAAAIIDQLWNPRVGGDASSILNRIVREWAANSGIDAAQNNWITHSTL